MKLSPSMLVPAVKQILAANLVPYIIGPPGVGKSDVVKQIAKAANMSLIDFRLSQASPTDLLGFPFINKGRADFSPPMNFLLDTDPLPEGKIGCILFLDEMSSAPLSVQAAAYRLLLDREVGQHKLHKSCFIIAAGNREEDNAIVNPMSTATQSRIVTLELEPTKEDWFKWASKNNINSSIISFLHYRPNQFHNFDPEHTDHTYPCPRTWHFLSNLLEASNPKKATAVQEAIIQGTVGQSAGIEFLAFNRICKDLPSYNSIINKPTEIPISDDAAVLYATVGYIADNMTCSTAEKAMPYIERMPKEMQVICLRLAIAKDPELSIQPFMNEWKISNSQII